MKETMKAALMAVLFVVILPGDLWSQDDPVEKPGKEETREEKIRKEEKTIIVSASRIEMEKRESGSHITVVTAEDIEQSGYTDIASLLQGIPGIHLSRNGAFGGQTTLAMRGGKSGNIAVLIDGVKMNNFTSVNRGFDMAHIRLHDIERIEITRGANSTTFGSEATAGVINIITKKSSDGKVTFDVEGGSYYTFNSGVAYGIDREKISFNAGLYGEYSDGISKITADDETDPYRNISASLGLRALPARDMDLEFMARYLDARFEVDDNASTGDTDRFNNNRNLATGLAFRHSPSPWMRYTASIGYMYYGYRDKDPGESAPWELVTHAPRGSVDVEFNIMEVNRIVIGGEWFLETGKVDFGSPIEESRFTHAYYIQDHLSLLDRIFIDVGMRLELNTDFGYFLSYNAGGSFIVPKTETNIKVNWGLGHRMPTYSEIYNPWEVANTSLDPESSMTVDAGVIQPLWKEKISLGTFFFYGEHYDLISYHDPDGNWMTPDGYFRNENGKVTFMGIESFVEITPLDWLFLKAAYTWTDARDTDGGRSQKRAEHQASLEGRATFIRKIDVSTKVVFVSDRIGYMDAELPWYIKWDLMVAWRVRENLKVHLRGENLTNSSYQEAKGYRMPGISIYGGVKASI